MVEKVYNCVDFVRAVVRFYPAKLRHQWELNVFVS